MWSTRNSIVYAVYAIVSFATLAFAQFPAVPQGVTTQQVRGQPGVTISYKQTFICETKAKGWAGYVHLPSSYLSDIETSEPYNASIFFWYFEARNNPSNASTTIYLAGGPGEPGISGALSDGGPCSVLRDGKTTVSNPWSWNTYTNMLYIDQPISTGFSYTALVNSTLDLLFLGQPETETGITPFDAYKGNVPPANATFLHGTLSEQNLQKTANNTLTAAKTLWHFSQAWFSSFNEYQTTNKAINIFGNSYGGYYVPVTASYFLQQNALLQNGSSYQSTKPTILPVDTVGWTNGCVDELVQAEWYPMQAYNNTYDLQVIPKDVYEQSLNNFTKPGGCRDLIVECRELGNLYDPQNLATNASVNLACVNALEYCLEYVISPYSVLSNRSAFDMAHLTPDPYPTSYWLAYANSATVQQALGVPLNFSTYSTLDNNIFLFKTGDAARIAGADYMEYLLKSGVKIAMMYGDRDYRCPWIGAEKLSLAVNWTDAAEFREAGYEYVQTNASYQGGVVRQRGNFSYTRIFEAGHDAQVYQPETVFQIYNRAIFNTDVATGQHGTSGACNNYTTTGPLSSFGIKNKLPVPPPPPNCELYVVSSSCTQQQYDALVAGNATIVDYNVVKPAGGSPGSIFGGF